jgi:hypothetical protein
LFALSRRFSEKGYFRTLPTIPMQGVKRGLFGLSVRGRSDVTGLPNEPCPDLTARIAATGPLF